MAKKKQGGAKKTFSSKPKASKSKPTKKSTKSSKSKKTVGKSAKSSKSKKSKSESSKKSTSKSTRSKAAKSETAKKEPTKSMLQDMTKDDLQEYAEKFKIKLSTNDTKDEMIEAFLDEYDDLEEDESKKKSEALVHTLIPPHRNLPDKEKKQVQEKYHVETLKMPKISMSDPAIQHMGAKEGDVIEITRMSITAGKIKFYRSVVRD